MKLGRYLMYSSGGHIAEWKTRPISEACLVSTLSSTTKEL